MQTAVSQPVTGNRSPKPARAPAIPYPELPDCERTPPALFWRAAWLRLQAEREALTTPLRKLYTVRGISTPLYSVLSFAAFTLENEARVAFAHLVRAGGLLYAWLPEGGAQ